MDLVNKGELLWEIEKGNTMKYHYFWGKEDPFSNFYNTIINVEYEGDILKFYSSEQLFMWRKCLEFNNPKAAMKIVQLGDVFPNEYRKIGRELPDWETYGAHWEQVKEEVMFDCLYYKFTQNSVLKGMLMNKSEHVIVEASPYDKYWGVGLGYRDQLIKHPKNWKGANRLGFLLMEVCERLWAERD